MGVADKDVLFKCHTSPQLESIPDRRLLEVQAIHEDHAPWKVPVGDGDSFYLTPAQGWHAGESCRQWKSILVP